MKKKGISIACLFLIIFMQLSGYAYADKAIDIARKGNELFDKDQFEEALKAYDESLSINPNDSIVNYNRAVVLYRLNKYEDAQKAFLMSISQNSKALEGKNMFNLGNSKFREGEKQEASDAKSAIDKYKEAADYFKRAIELLPEDIDAKYNYEYVLKKIKDFQKRKILKVVKNLSFKI